MFDDYYNIRPLAINVSASMNVTEKRAPTDESVRLLSEMERAAQARVNDSIFLVLEPVGLELMVQRIISAHSLDEEYAILYKLNGHKRVVRYTHRAVVESEEAVIDGLQKALAEDLANMILLKQSVAMRGGKFTRL